MFDKIIRDKNMVGGSPTIIGRRLTVFDVISGIFYSESISSWLNEFELDRESAEQAIRYCSKLECINKPTFDFCEGCQLYSLVENKNFDEFRNTIIESKGHLIIDNNEIYIGCVEDYKNSKYGQKGWIQARIINKELDQ